MQNHPGFAPPFTPNPNAITPEAMHAFHNPLVQTTLYGAFPFLARPVPQGSSSGLPTGAATLIPPVLPATANRPPRAPSPAPLQPAAAVDKDPTPSTSPTPVKRGPGRPRKGTSTSSPKGKGKGKGKSKTAGHDAAPPPLPEGCQNWSEPGGAAKLAAQTALFEAAGYKLWDSERRVRDGAWDEIMRSLAQTPEYRKMFSKKIQGANGNVEWKFNTSLRSVQRTLDLGVAYFTKLVQRKDAEVSDTGSSHVHNSVLTTTFTSWENILGIMKHTLDGQAAPVGSKPWKELKQYKRERDQGNLICGEALRGLTPRTPRGTASATDDLHDQWNAIDEAPSGNEDYDDDGEDNGDTAVESMGEDGDEDDREGNWTGGNQQGDATLKMKKRKRNASSSSSVRSTSREGSNQKELNSLTEESGNMNLLAGKLCRSLDANLAAVAAQGAATGAPPPSSSCPGPSKEEVEGQVKLKTLELELERFRSQKAAAAHASLSAATQPAKLPREDLDELGIDGGEFSGLYFSTEWASTFCSFPYPLDQEDDNDDDIFMAARRCGGKWDMLGDFGGFVSRFSPSP